MPTAPATFEESRSITWNGYPYSYPEVPHEKDKDRYVIDKDSVHEGSGKDFNSIVSLALVRATFATALELSDALGVDGDKHRAWRHILDHLSGYATMEKDGKTIFRYTERGTEFWRGNTLGIQHIYPALGVGLESDPKLIEVSLNTIDYMQRWFDNNGDNSFFPAAALLGYKPDVICAKLNEYVTGHYRPNGLRKHSASQWPPAKTAQRSVVDGCEHNSRLREILRAPAGNLVIEGCELEPVECTIL